MGEEGVGRGGVGACLEEREALRNSERGEEREGVHWTWFWRSGGNSRLPLSQPLPGRKGGLLLLLVAS